MTLKIRKTGRSHVFHIIQCLAFCTKAYGRSSPEFAGQSLLLLPFFHNFVSTRPSASSKWLFYGRIRAVVHVVPLRSSCQALFIFFVWCGGVSCPFVDTSIACAHNDSRTRFARRCTACSTRQSRSTFAMWYWTLWRCASRTTAIYCWWVPSLIILGCAADATKNVRTWNCGIVWQQHPVRTVTKMLNKPFLYNRTCDVVLNARTVCIKNNGNLLLVSFK